MSTSPASPASTQPGPAAATYLDRIVAAHRVRAAADTRPAVELAAQARAMSTPSRGFTKALRDSEGIAVIAEIKRRSPSKGDLFAGLVPAEIANQYQRGGASCLSILTDADHFGGSVADLQEARESVSLPVIRKDFTVDIRDVYDARLMGADCVLLIAAALTDVELESFHREAEAIGIDALVEIHDEVELDRALAVGATLIGVNQRDLHTFKVDQERAVRVGAAMPSHITRVAESGVRGPDDAAALHAAGFHAVLVGESLVTSGDPEAATRALKEASYAR